MNTYHTSNAQAQMTHAAWDAADAMDFDALDEFETAERMRREAEKEEEGEIEQ